MGVSGSVVNDDQDRVVLFRPMCWHALDPIQADRMPTLTGEGHVFDRHTVGHRLDALTRVTRTNECPHLCSNVGKVVSALNELDGLGNTPMVRLMAAANDVQHLGGGDEHA